MPDKLEKLRPDRDLQCYFERPSAIAALSGASPTGFSVSGSWRQQFDWAVIEWNQHNVIEHPMFRHLPDGDLSGLQLSYEEVRTNCIPLDSHLYPTVDWPYLRIWAQGDGVEEFYRVRLKDYAEPVEGGYESAFAEMELMGSVTAGDYVGISFLQEHYTCQLLAGDTLESAAQSITDSINSFSSTMQAIRIGSTIKLIYVDGSMLETSTTGANGNRLGAYGFVSGTGTEFWSPAWVRFSGGVSPSKWKVTLDFSALVDMEGRAVPMQSVRKMRWTYSAELQHGAFERNDFQVLVTNWTVTGSNRDYQVMGPGSRRVEDDDRDVEYSGTWQIGRGNFSGSTIHETTAPGSSFTCQYHCPQPHELYLGTRYTPGGAVIEVEVDGSAALPKDLRIPGEDVLVRLPLGTLESGSHTVNVTHAGADGSQFFFDFLEIGIPTTDLPAVSVDSRVTLATDWDTDHSISVAPERTAWMIHSLGFHGRANHYVGALWHYELVRSGHEYASATIDFTGTPVFSATTEIRIGQTNKPPEDAVVIPHVNRIGDTAATIAQAFALELNRGYTAVWAEASGSQLTIHARAMGAAGNEVTIAAGPISGPFCVVASSATLAGGTDGDWRTDLEASPRLNRAVRDWSRSFLRAMSGYGIDVTSAFSMELQHGDPSPTAGIAQQYPSGAAVQLNTPALQTNFSPTSLKFWKEVFREMAGIHSEAGLQPYLQFGEVQWWYFPYDGSGMPFYDAYTQSEFQAAYGRAMATIPNHQADPAQYPDEVEFLPTLIGAFTNAIIQDVRASHPDCRFEVLYPPDVNETPLNSLINYPSAAWTPAVLDCLKTESFTYTYARDLNRARGTIEYGETRGFPRSQRSFLVGIGDATTAWMKEVSIARSQGLESIVLFALDQFCLIGYPAPLPQGASRAVFQG